MIFIVWRYQKFYIQEFDIRWKYYMRIQCTTVLFCIIIFFLIIHKQTNYLHPLNSNSSPSVSNDRFCCGTLLARFCQCRLWKRSHAHLSAHFPPLLLLQRLRVDWGRLVGTSCWLWTQVWWSNFGSKMLPLSTPFCLPSCHVSDLPGPKLSIDNFLLDDLVVQFEHQLERNDITTASASQHQKSPFPNLHETFRIE